MLFLTSAATDHSHGFSKAFNILYKSLVENSDDPEDQDYEGIVLLLSFYIILCHMYKSQWLTNFVFRSLSIKAKGKIFYQLYIAASNIFMIVPCIFLTTSVIV